MYARQTLPCVATFAVSHDAQQTATRTGSVEKRDRSTEIKELTKRMRIRRRACERSSPAGLREVQSQSAAARGAHPRTHWSRHRRPCFPKRLTCTRCCDGTDRARAHAPARRHQRLGRSSAPCAQRRHSSEMMCTRGNKERRRRRDTGTYRAIHTPTACTFAAVWSGNSGQIRDDGGGGDER